MSRRMIQSLDVVRARRMGTDHGAGERRQAAKNGRMRRAAQPQGRKQRPALPLYTTYDICEMLVDIFLKPKDVIESRRLARNLWTTYHLQVGNRATR